jgi:hypothetical protein
MSRMRKVDATTAALDWVGMYEADDSQYQPEDEHDWRTPDITLMDAVSETREHYAGTKTAVTASVVARRYPGFPEDMVAAYFMLDRMYESMQKRMQTN